ncbi:MAG: reverse transcriptase domain-containing protein [Bryobacteraceae bacterium]
MPPTNSLPGELENGSYRPGGYRSFPVHDPKPRLISAAPFRDRVVHHALTRTIEPIFERRFTADSYACRRGMGTHAALRRASSACRRFPYVLKCDVWKYFPSIDHEILKGLLARVLKCPRTLALAGVIIDGSNPKDDAVCYFPGDDLFTPHDRRRGLPLGNQTSQFFANVYLNPLDHFVRRELRPGHYVRYVDDFLMFSRDAAELERMRGRISRFLCGLRLRLHDGKSRVYRTADGVAFLGWRVLPDRLRLARRNVTAFRRRLRRLQEDYAAGLAGWRDVRARIRAWIAHAEHGDTWQLRRRVLGEYKFRRGCVV